MIKLGLVGEKLSHSFSPKIHTYIFNKTGIKAQYLLYEFEKKISEEILSKMKENNIRGFNITVPYKEILFDKLEYISNEAKEIGAINTVLINEGIAYGYNTDYYGIIKIFDKIKYEVKGKICYLLGSGGACKATIVALKDLGASKIVVVSRDLSKTSINMKKKFPYIEMVEYSEIKQGDILINTTPVGMFPNVDKTPLSEENIIKFKVAIDLIYNPIETEFLKIANKNGLIVQNGLPMLIQQAIKAEEIWQNVNFKEELYYEVENYLLEEK